MGDKSPRNREKKKKKGEKSKTTKPTSSPILPTQSK